MRESDVSQLINECEKNAIPDEQIDTSEIPEVTSLEGFYFGNTKLFKAIKDSVTIRLDRPLLAHLKKKGRGWQTELNNFLVSAYMKGQI